MFGWWKINIDLPRSFSSFPNYRFSFLGTSSNSFSITSTEPGNLVTCFAEEVLATTRLMFRKTRSRIYRTFFGTYFCALFYAKRPKRKIESNIPKLFRRFLALLQKRYFLEKSKAKIFFNSKPRFWQKTCYSTSMSTFPSGSWNRVMGTQVSWK